MTRQLNFLFVPFWLLAFAMTNVANAQSELGKVVPAGLIVSEAGALLLSVQEGLWGGLERSAGLEGPYWEPTEAEIAALDEAISEHIEASDVPRAEWLENLITDYKKQYIGYTENGRAMIHANAFCRSDWERDDYWLRQYVWVFDGGACYFKVTYDATDKRIVSIFIHGSA